MRRPLRSTPSPDGPKLYDKWFMQKIPPKGLNLNTPIGAELKHDSPNHPIPRIPIPTRRCDTFHFF